jgi:hypothetical protein
MKYWEMIADKLGAGRLVVGPLQRRHALRLALDSLTRIAKVAPTFIHSDESLSAFL